ncbi:MAG: cytochrome c [Chloroflexi bacterium]|nr:cytochrome c [Chloroflexota bacterium]
MTEVPPFDQKPLEPLDSDSAAAIIPEMRQQIAQLAARIQELENQLASKDAGLMPFLVFFGAFALVLAAILGGRSGQPAAMIENAPAAAAQPTAAPTAGAAAEIAALVEDPAGAASPQVGRWISETFQPAGDATFPPMRVVMDVADGGAMKGAIILYPNTVPPEAANLVTTNGCRVEFSSLEAAGTPVGGRFVNATDALVDVNIATCAVKFYGDVVVEPPVVGQWLVRYSEDETQLALAPKREATTPLEIGYDAFQQFCSECHGIRGRGNPGIPALISPVVDALTDDQIHDIITNGRINTVMPVFGNRITEEQKQAIILLLRNPDELLK